MAVIGVLAHAHVGGHQHPGVIALDGTHRLLHDALRVVALGSQRVLLGGQAEEQHAADSQFRRLAHFLGHHVKRDLVAARHRLYWLSHSVAVHHEHRVDELLGRKAGLSRQVAQRVGAAQAAQAGLWVTVVTGHGATPQIGQKRRVYTWYISVTA